MILSDNERRLMAENSQLKTILGFRDLAMHEGRMALEDELNAAFRLVQDTDPLWNAIIRLVMVQKDIETVGVCQPKLEDSDRHFNAGRLASLLDLLQALMETWQKSKSDPP